MVMKRKTVMVTKIRSKADDGDDEDEEDEQEIKVQNTSLKTLLLAGNGVGDPFLESVMGIFGKESQLQELEFIW